jgi:hypothetical protein
MRKPVLSMMNFVDAARRDVLTREEEAYGHGSPAFQLFRAEQVRCGTKWLAPVMPRDGCRVGVS